MSRKLDGLKSNEFLIRELEDAGYSLWYVARLGDRVIGGHRLDDVVKRALTPTQKGNHGKSGRPHGLPPSEGENS
jgi:hypothetical protein